MDKSKINWRSSNPTHISHITWWSSATFQLLTHQRSTCYCKRRTVCKGSHQCSKVWKGLWISRTVKCWKLITVTKWVITWSADKVIKSLVVISWRCQYHYKRMERTHRIVVMGRHFLTCRACRLLIVFRACHCRRVDRQCSFHIRQLSSRWLILRIVHCLRIVSRGVYNNQNRHLV